MIKIAIYVLKKLFKNRKGLRDLSRSAYSMVFDCLFLRRGWGVIKWVIFCGRHKCMTSDSFLSFF